jgi:hypothetical protein
MDQINLGRGLIASGASLQNAHGVALSVRGATINGNVVLSHGFKARGAIILDRSSTVELVFSEGSIENPDGAALSANHTRVAGDVLLNDGFHSLGAIHLETTTIGGVVDCADGTFEQTAEGVVIAAAKPSASR